MNSKQKFCNLTKIKFKKRITLIPIQVWGNFLFQIPQTHFVTIDKIILNFTCIFNQMTYLINFVTDSNNTRELFYKFLYI